MHVEILQENLVKAISQAGRFVQSRASLPVLQNLSLTAGSKGLVIYATNTDTAIFTTHSAKVIEPGEVVVPAKLLSEYVHLLSPGKVELLSEGSVLKIIKSEHRASVAGVDPKDFPRPPEIEYSLSFEISAKQLKSIVSKVGFAASLEEARPVYTAINLSVDKGKFVVVATDGFRLSLLEDKMSGDLNLDEPILVPSKVLAEVEKLVRDAGGQQVKIGYSQIHKSLEFVVGEMVIQTRLIEGNYPPYRKILPEKTRVKAQVDRLGLLEAVRVASIFARAGGNVVRLAFESEGIKVFARASGAGENQSQVEAKVSGLDDQSLEAAFNGRYLLDILDKLEQVNVTIGLNEALSPVVFTQDKDTFRHIIMPVKV